TVRTKTNEEPKKDNSLFYTFHVKAASLRMHTGFLQDLQERKTILVDKFDLNFLIEICLTNESTLPAVRAYGNLPSLNLIASARILKDIRKVLQSLSLGSTTAVAARKWPPEVQNPRGNITTNNALVEGAFSVKIVILKLQDE